MRCRTKYQIASRRRRQFTFYHVIKWNVFFSVSVTYYFHVEKCSVFVVCCHEFHSHLGLYSYFLSLAVSRSVIWFLSLFLTILFGGFCVRITIFERPTLYAWWLFACNFIRTYIHIIKTPRDWKTFSQFYSFIAYVPSIQCSIFEFRHSVVGVICVCGCTTMTTATATLTSDAFSRRRITICIPG